jgi:hypothetical protein
VAASPNDQTAVAGPVARFDLRELRRVANVATYDMARRYGADKFDVLQFVCECDRPECRLIVTRAVFDFDPGSPAGSILALH